MHDASFLPDRPDGSSEPMPDPVPPVRAFEVGDTVRISENARGIDHAQHGKTGKIALIVPGNPIIDTVYVVKTRCAPYEALCYASELLLIKAARP